MAAAIFEGQLDADILLKYGGAAFAQDFAQRRFVSVHMLLGLAKVLKLADPSVLVHTPTRTELTLLRDDELLRTYVSRVQDVRFEVPRRLGSEIVAEVGKAVDLMRGALKKDIIMADGVVHPAFPRRGQHLTYANQVQDLLARLNQLGLVVYAGMFTTVEPFRPSSSREHNIKTTSPFKVERVLLLDVDLAEPAA